MNRFLYLLVFTVFSSQYAIGEGIGHDNYFTVMYNGEELSAGDEIIVSDASEMDGKLIYMPHFTVNNVMEKELLLSGAMYYTDTPDKKMAEENPEFWGRPQFCMSSCFANGDDEKVGSGVEYVSNKVVCLPEVVLCDRAADSAYRLRLVPCIGSLENGNYFEIDDAAFEIKILFTQKGAGIDSAFDIYGNDPEDPVYYNLNGEIVTNPERGIYIVKENGRFHKKFLLTPVAPGRNDR